MFLRDLRDKCLPCRQGRYSGLKEYDGPRHPNMRGAQKLQKPKRGHCMEKDREKRDEAERQAWLQSPWAIQTLVLRTTGVFFSRTGW
jgi:hypothetical protein